MLLKKKDVPVYYWWQVSSDSDREDSNKENSDEENLDEEN